MPNTQGKTQAQGSEVAKRSFTEEQKQRALVALAAASGNARLASRMLAKEDFTIDHKTLWRWQQSQPDDYARIRADLLPRIREAQADKQRAQEMMDLQGSQVASELILNRLPAMEDRDLVNAKKGFDVGSGIHAEKALLYDGQPTQRIHRTSDEIMRELEAEGLKLEAVDVEVVEEADVVGSETSVVGSAVSAVTTRAPRRPA